MKTPAPFPANTPGLATLNTTGGPPNQTPVKFIRWDPFKKKLIVTKDGKSTTDCNLDEISPVNSLKGTPR